MENFSHTLIGEQVAKTNFIKPKHIRNSPIFLFLFYSSLTSSRMTRLRLLELAMAYPFQPWCTRKMRHIATLEKGEVLNKWKKSTIQIKNLTTIANKIDFRVRVSGYVLMRIYAGLKGKA